MIPTAATDAPNEPSMASDARPPDMPRGSRRPAMLFARNPSSGRRGIQISIAATLQCPQCVGVEAFRMPEQRNHDGKAHCCFGGGNRDHKKHDDLPVCRSEKMSERNERQVDR